MDRQFWQWLDDKHKNHPEFSDRIEKSLTDMYEAYSIVLDFLKEDTIYTAEMGLEMIGAWRRHQEMTSKKR